MEEAMWTLCKHPEVHFVEYGRVMCPIRGDIDVERCFGCPWLRSMRLDDAEPQIVCEANRRGDLTASTVTPSKFEDTGF
jgi:hypothetical protein